MFSLRVSRIAKFVPVNANNLATYATSTTFFETASALSHCVTVNLANIAVIEPKEVAEVVEVAKEVLVAPP